MRIALAVIGLLLILGVVVFTNTNETNTVTVNTNTVSALPGTNANTNTAANTNNTTTNNAPSESSIVVTASGFSPRTLTVARGTTVTWTNGSGRRAYVAPDTHPSHVKYRGVWDDSAKGDMENSQTYSFTFTTAGTYTYHNHLNSSQTGTVIVTE